MKPIKVYAEERGVSHQAVYQMISTHKDELSEHIVKHGRTRYLTPAAEDILDRYRNKSQIIIDAPNGNNEVEKLRSQVESLLIKIADQADKISELAQWKADNALLIAEASQQSLLLESKTKEIELLEGFIKDAKDNIEFIQEEKNREIEQLRKELEAEKNRSLTFKERITGKKI